jgi:hypothetical protein
VGYVKLRNPKSVSSRITAKHQFAWAVPAFLKDALIKSVTPAQAGVQVVDFPGFRLSPE